MNLLFEEIIMNATTVEELDELIITGVFRNFLFGDLNEKFESVTSIRDKKKLKN